MLPRLHCILLPSPKECDWMDQHSGLPFSKTFSILAGL